MKTRTLKTPSSAPNQEQLPFSNENPDESNTVITAALNNTEDAIIAALTPFISPLGYQIIHAVLQHRPKVLRLFIDHAEPLNTGASTDVLKKGPKIGIEDCTRVSKALDEPIETDPGLLKMLPEAFELEVSSPGVDRPLRKPIDFQKYAGEKVRLHTFRPLTADELNNAKHAEKNAKQKNFLGVLLGFQDGRVQLQNLESMKPLKGAKSKRAPETTNSHEERITIPLQLISKANLEPDFSKIVSHEERE